MGIDKVKLNKPHIVFNAADSIAWGDITGILPDQSDLQAALNAKTNDSDLALVAKSGEYSDLKNKPDLSIYAKSSDLAPVAKSGEYGDLTNKPYIPENTSDLNNDDGFITSASLPVPTNTVPKMDGVGNAGSEVAFARGDHRHPIDTSRAAASDLATTNQNVTNVTMALDDYKTANDSRVESAESEITANKSATTALNDRVGTVENYKADKSSLAIVATSGKYTDLTGTPDLSPFAKSEDLALVATSGSYTDLTDKPDVYTKTETNNLLIGKVDKVPGKGLSDENYTTAEKTKLSGIEAGAEVNVQADWNQTDTAKDDFIKNKPVLGTIAAENKNNYVTVSNFNTAIDGKVSNIQAGVNVSVDSSDVTHPVVSVTGVVTRVRAGTNVSVSGTVTEPIVSVTGIEFPEKFTSTDSVTGIIGDSVTGLSYSNIAEIITGSSFKVNDVVIFANGMQGQVIAYDSGSGTYDVVLVQIPQEISWGTIGGMMNNQSDLQAALNAKTNDSDLALVAKSGEYSDLKNKPDLSIYAKDADLTAVAKTGSYTNLTNKPDLSIYAENDNLAPVATSGDYDDLVNRPDHTIYVKSSDLAPVATSGSYNDLTDKPDVFTKTETNNLLIGKVDKVPGKGLSDENYTTAEKTKLSGIEAGAEVNVQADWNQTDTAKDDFIKNKPVLALVATSGSYNDLINKPDLSVYVKSSDLAPVAKSGEYGDLTNKPYIPENTSDLNNDDGFITSASLPVPTNTVPKMDGVGNAGSEVAFARGDHRHPFDSSRAADSDLQGYKTTNDTRVEVVEGKVSVNELAITDLTDRVDILEGYKSLLDFFLSTNTVTTLSYIEMSSQTVYADINADQILNVEGTPPVGQPVHIYVKNVGASDVTVTIPEDYINMSDPEIIVPVGGYIEISIVYDINISNYKIVVLEAV